MTKCSEISTGMTQGLKFLPYGERFKKLNLFIKPAQEFFQQTIFSSENAIM